eukprot:2896733-Pyramimonas_sp.AAC.1
MSQPIRTVQHPQQRRPASNNRTARFAPRLWGRQAVCLLSGLRWSAVRTGASNDVLASAPQWGSG